MSQLDALLAEPSLNGDSRLDARRATSSATPSRARARSSAAWRCRDEGAADRIARKAVDERVA